MADLLLRPSTTIYHSGSPVVEICEGDRVLMYYHKDKDGCYITIPSAIPLVEAHRAISYLISVQDYGFESRQRQREKETIIRSR